MRRIIILLLFLLFIPKSGNSSEYIWTKDTKGIRENNLNHVVVIDEPFPSIFTTSFQNVYVKDKFGIFKHIFNSSFVNDIFYKKDYTQKFYVATDNGLYQSNDFGLHWERIYYARSRLLGVTLSVVEDVDTLYVGTLKGLMIKEGSKNWKGNTSCGIKEPVYKLLSDNKFIYVLTQSDLYSLNKKNDVCKKIFTQKENFREEIGDPFLNVEERVLKDIQSVDDQESKETSVFLASEKGIFISQDDGGNWDRLASDELPLKDVTSLAVRCHGRCNVKENGGFDIVIGSKRGAFLYKEGVWMPIYKGMETSQINDLALKENGNIYAATDKGVFCLGEDAALPFLTVRVDEMADLMKIYDDEPTISEVQKWAIDYAEVHPKKIKNWRKQARQSAWIPHVSIGIDQRRNKTVSDSLWGSYSSGGQHYIGPDDKTFYDNFGWDVSLSWDLSETVWNPDQTSIDSRSKLLVELREDILDQVTRIYFERRRIQMELETGMDQDGEKDVLMDKQLRLAELTALLDAYTGGNFNKFLNFKP